MQAENGTYYRHRYGGIYRVLESKVLNTIDKSQWIVYKHVYPFDEEVWCRPKEEWEDGRFEMLTPSQLREACQADREKLKTEISENKAASKK